MGALSPKDQDKMAEVEAKAQMKAAQAEAYSIKAKAAVM